MPTVLFYNPPLRARDDPARCLRFSWHKKARVHPSRLLQSCCRFGKVVCFAAAVKRSFAFVVFERESDASAARAAAMAEQMPGLSSASTLPFDAAPGVRLAIEPYAISADLHTEDEAALRSASQLSELLPLGWTGGLAGMIAAATAGEEATLRASGIADELAASREDDSAEKPTEKDKEKDNVFLGVAPPFVACHMVRPLDGAEVSAAAVASEPSPRSVALPAFGDGAPFLAGLPAGYAVISAAGATHAPIVAGAAAAAAAAPPASSTDRTSASASALPLQLIPVDDNRYLICTAAFPPAASRGRVVPGPVPGLTLVHEFISEAEEAALLAYLDRDRGADVDTSAAPPSASAGDASATRAGAGAAAASSPASAGASSNTSGSVWEGGSLVRRVQHYGFGFDYIARKVVAPNTRLGSSATSAGSAAEGAAGAASGASEAASPNGSAAAGHTIRVMPLQADTPLSSVIHQLSRFGFLGTQRGAPDALPRPPVPASRSVHETDDVAAYRGVAEREHEERLLERCSLAVPLPSKAGLMQWLAEQQGIPIASLAAGSSSADDSAADAAADVAAASLDALFPIGSFPLANQLTVNEYRRGQGIAGHVDTHEGFGDGVVSLSLAADVVMEFTRAARDGEGDDDDGEGNDGPAADGGYRDGTGRRAAASGSASGSGAGGAGEAAAAVAVNPSGAPKRGMRHAYVLLPRRSLLCIRGEARFAWAHAIPARTTDFVDGRLSLRPERRVSITLRRVWPDGRPCACRWPSLCRPQAVPHKELFSPHLRKLVGVIAPADATAATAPVTSTKAAAGGGSSDSAVAASCTTADASSAALSPAAASAGTEPAAPDAAAGAAAAGAAADGPSVLRTPALESRHVHALYDAIAPHFSSTRHSPWPRVEAFMRWLPPGSLVVDAGCGNGKYLGIRRGDGLPEGAEPGAVPPTHAAKGSGGGGKGSAAGAEESTAAALSAAAASAATAATPGSQCVHSIGFDRSAGLVGIAAGPDRRLEAGVGDALCLPVRPGCADAVLSIAVLHHISSRERRARLIAEAIRAVRPADAAAGRQLLPHGADSLLEAGRPAAGVATGLPDAAAGRRPAAGVATGLPDAAAGRRPAAGVATGLIFVQAWALEQGADSKRHFVEATDGAKAGGAVTGAAVAASDDADSASSATATGSATAGASVAAGAATASSAASEGKDVFVPWHLTLPFLGAAADSKKKAAAAERAAAAAAAKKARRDRHTAGAVADGSGADGGKPQMADEGVRDGAVVPSAAAGVAGAPSVVSAGASATAGCAAAGVEASSAAVAPAATPDVAAAAEAAAAIAALSEAGGAVDATRRAVVFQRYCHMYKAGELEGLAAEAVAEVARWSQPQGGSSSDGSSSAKAVKGMTASGSSAALLYSARAAAALASYGIAVPVHLIVPPAAAGGVDAALASVLAAGAVSGSGSGSGIGCAAEVVDSWWERDNWCMLLRRLV